MTAAISALISGVRLNRRAVAAGIINIAALTRPLVADGFRERFSDGVGLTSEDVATWLEQNATPHTANEVKQLSTLMYLSQRRILV